MNNIRKFQESITQELDVVKNRVRNLIGDAHWGEEGRFKEVVLKNVLRKFLPNNLSVGTGFIIKATGLGDEMKISKQLDIIIYDNSLPLLFSEGDFIITTYKNVRGIIEVKSNITHNTLSNVISQFENSIKDFISDFKRVKSKKIFAGIFAFDFLEGNINSGNIDDSLRNSRKIVNHISLGKNYFIRYWKNKDRLAIPVNGESDFYNIYDIQDLSFSYFISNLIDIVCGGLDDRYWYSFPIEGTKEIYRIREVNL
ncbi:DUF6602 domain-containing protein [Bacteroides sp.]|uniref:DUF6602 domain-containing protein n=1 Tax=Bacteroides sp. TaxID=29523 RepID=UPI0025C06CFF|nr:DUF6602 domain-containing protein [Bacteroides sp.]